MELDHLNTTPDPSHPALIDIRFTVVDSRSTEEAASGNASLTTAEPRAGMEPPSKAETPANAEPWAGKEPPSTLGSQVKIEPASEAMALERETSSGRKSPLILHLHGFGQNRTQFLSQTRSLTTLEGIHVYPDGVYPVLTRSPSSTRRAGESPRSWYVYEGDPVTFISALEQASRFLESLLDRLEGDYGPREVLLQGYSMGGYLAGYLALSRPDRFRAVAVTGCRLKTECVERFTAAHRRLAVLAVHGKADERVDGRRQQESVELLRQNAVPAEMVWTEGEHAMDAHQVEIIRAWFDTL